jgi:nicotinamidase-related amidase
MVGASDRNVSVRRGYPRTLATTRRMLSRHIVLCGSRKAVFAVATRGTCGCVSDESGFSTALLVVDVLNPYDHEDADRLVASMAGVVAQIAQLVQRARAAEIPVIYVNDNYGHWNSSSGELLEIALNEGRHPELVEPLRPPQDASFVIKARHSVFYETPLEYLLRQLGVSRIMLCGQVTEQCILYSALDAYVRHMQVVVPSDAVAHIHADLADAALEMMRVNMDAEIVSAGEVVFDTASRSGG